MPAQTIIQLRRDTAANWTSTDPILSAGEAGFETDTSKLKIGDGATAWSSLAYFGNLDSLNNVGDVTITSAATGQVLQFNRAKWVNATLNTLPDQNGNDGKYLTTDGTDASWAVIDLSSKQDVITGAASTVTISNLQTARALTSDASGKIAVSTVTSTELGQLSGILGNVQSQISSRATSDEVARSRVTSILW
jgi:hypothetical protein